MSLRGFFSRIFAGGEDRSPWGDYWFEPIASRTLSGVRVSAETAMRLSAVFRAVSLVSGHMAMFPVRFYETGTRKRIQHPLLKLLNKRPNRWQNAYEWREMLQGHLELRGNAYSRIYADNRGQIEELVPIHPDRIKPEMLAGGEYRWQVRNADGTSTQLARGEVWHLRNLSNDGILGLSTIDCARESLGMPLSAQEYAARFFSNDAKPTGGWIEYPGTIKDAESRKVLTESIRAATSGAKRHGLMVLDRDMKYHEVGATNKDAQFLELRKFSITDIARWFGIPPHKLGDLDRATFSNIEQQALEYIQDALLPRATRWESAIESDLLFDDEQIDIDFDFHALLRGDSNQRASYYHQGILDGWLTRNEARDMEGREPLDGLDEPLRPLNMVEEDDAEDLEQDVEAIEPPAEQKQDDGEDGASARLAALLRGNVERIARRWGKGGALDAGMIAEALAIPPAAAAEWRDRPTHYSTESDLTASLLALAEQHA